MPLLPLPDNNTDRVFLEYTSRGIPHTMLLRYPAEGDIALALASARAIAQELKELMLQTDSFTGVRYSVAGSLISLPGNFAPIFGTQLATAGEEDPESYFYSVVGRDISEGRKVQYQYYATRAGNARPGNNRYPAGQNAEIDTFWNAINERALNGSEAVHLCTIANTEFVVNGYTNVANNAYWQRRQRRA